MDIILNGEQREIEPGTTITDLLDTFNLKPELTLVQRNDDIIDRPRYNDLTIEQGDRIELVRMVAGG